MNAEVTAQWMMSKLAVEGCIYQDDVVDYLVKNNGFTLLRENTDGNLVIGLELLKAFKRISETTVVWVRSDLYWRWRVAEDEPGREAQG